MAALVNYNHSELHRDFSWLLASNLAQYLANLSQSRYIFIIAALLQCVLCLFRTDLPITENEFEW